MSQKSFCGKTRPINTGALTFSIGRHLCTHSTDGTLPQRPLHKCLFPHRVSENMQTLRKAPAFEILLLCFPSKHFLFISPLTAPTSSPTPAAHSKFCPMPGCGMQLPQLLLGGPKPPVKLPLHMPASARSCSYPGCPIAPAAGCSQGHQSISHN